MLPALAYLVTVPLNMALGRPRPGPAQALAMVQTLRCLANGFIVTSMLWAAALAMLIDGRLRRRPAFSALAGVRAFFGIIHSPLAAEQINRPDTVLELVRADAVQGRGAVPDAVPLGGGLCVVGAAVAGARAGRAGGTVQFCRP